jgi:hypothetical protein
MSKTAKFDKKKTQGILGLSSASNNAVIIWCKNILVE